MRIYIEKYVPIQGNMLADFTEESGFEDFCRSINQIVDRKRDFRTMLWIENLRFEGPQYPREGSTYLIPTEFLTEFLWVKEPGFGNGDTEQLESFSEVVAFRTKPNYKGKNFFSNSLNHLGRKVKEDNTNEWDCTTPTCGLQLLGDDLKVVVRNVGQGNWNEVYSHCECIVIYDMGASIYSTHKELKDLVKSSKAFRSKSISLIISHWDIDHYIALLEVPESSLKDLCFAYFPDHLPTVTSQTVYNRLQKNCNYLVPISNIVGRNVSRRVSLHKYSHGSNFTFFRAEISTNRNKSGLSLAVWGRISVVLLVADHHYSQIERDIVPSIPTNLSFNLIVPHHGGDAGKLKWNLLKNSISVDKAIISTGLNGYGHPTSSNMNELKKMGFTILRTDLRMSDIVLKL